MRFGVFGLAKARTGVDSLTDEESSAAIILTQVTFQLLHLVQGPHLSRVSRLRIHSQKGEGSWPNSVLYA